MLCVANKQKSETKMAASILKTRFKQIKDQKERNLLGTKTQSGNFQGNPRRQATKRHLKKLNGEKQ